MRKYIVSILFIFACYFAAHAQVGGSGILHLSGSPNANSGLNLMQQSREAVLAFDTLNSKLYFYKHSLSAGSRWVEFVLGSASDTDTRLDNPYVQNDSLKFDIKNILNVVVGSEGIPLSAINKVNSVNGLNGTVVLDLYLDAGVLKLTGDASGVTLPVNTDNQTLTWNTNTNTLSISGGNSVTIPLMVGASGSGAGQKGLVPQPVTGEQGYFLRGDGTWANPSLGGDNWGTQVVLHGSEFVGNGTSGNLLEIAGNGIALSKLNQVAGSRILGNAGSTTADVQAIELGPGLAFNAGKLEATGVASNNEYFDGVTGSTVTAVGTLPSSVDKITVTRDGVKMRYGSGRDITINTTTKVITFNLALQAENIQITY